MVFSKTEGIGEKRRPGRVTFAILMLARVPSVSLLGDILSLPFILLCFFDLTSTCEFPTFWL